MSKELHFAEGMTEDDLNDWFTESAWDASEDSEPVYVVDKEALGMLVQGQRLIPEPLFQWMQAKIMAQAHNPECHQHQPKEQSDVR